MRMDSCPLWGGGANRESQGLQGKGQPPVPRGGGHPQGSRSLLPLSPFWTIMGQPALGCLRGPSPPWPWSGALTADLGTAATVGGRPLLLESAVSVSVCSILRAQDESGVWGSVLPLSHRHDPHPLGTRCPCPQLPTSPLHTLELLPSATPDPLAPHLVVVGTEVFEVSEADVAETDDNGDDQDHECEHGRGG